MSGNGSVSNIGVPVALDRRTVLRAGAVTAAAAALPAPAAYAASPVFGHGIASGDPLPDGVVLWSRVTVGPQALPGSGIGAPATVRWEIADDAGFTTVVATGSFIADADSDHTVKVDVRGLAPARDYHYRFHALGATSPAGRTRTAPAEADSPACLRFGVVSCANWEAGYFAAYRHLAARDDLDAVIHLGDYLYEYSSGSFEGHAGTARQHEPVHEIISLADYRIRHGQYKTDPDLMALHARVPFICTWDDHETANNAWSAGAGNHDPASEGSWADRRAASIRAYTEWMPVRLQTTAGETRIYRRLRFGTLAELSMLDLRSYRDRQPELGTREGDDPARTLTGARQMEWLAAGLVSGSARWQVVGNSVMIAPLAFPPLNPETSAAVTEVFGIPREGLVLNTDQWDGYPADRHRLLQALTHRGGGDVVFLTGDIHSSWASDVPLDAARYPGGPTAGVEFVVPSVTSTGIGDMLPTPPRTGSVALAESVRALNRHIHYTELDSHGYGIVELVPARVRMEWYHVGDVTDARTGVRTAAAWELPHGGRLRPGG